MKRADYLSKMADNLVKQAEQARNLSKFGTRSPGLFSLLTGVPEVEALKKEAESLTTELKIKLEDRLRFFENKQVEDGNIQNLKREIKKCDLVLSEPGFLKISEIKELIDWNLQIRTKYGF